MIKSGVKVSEPTINEEKAKGLINDNYVIFIQHNELIPRNKKPTTKDYVQFKRTYLIQTTLLST